MVSIYGVFSPRCSSPRLGVGLLKPLFTELFLFYLSYFLDISPYFSLTNYLIGYTMLNRFINNLQAIERSVACHETVYCSIFYKKA